MRFVRVAAMALIATLMAGCFGRGSSVSLESYDPLEQAIVALYNDPAHAPIPVASVSDFDWDEVGYVYEGMTRQQLQEWTGDPIIQGDRYTSSATLFVFRLRGDVVKAVMIGADSLAADITQQWFGSDAVLTNRGGTVVSLANGGAGG